MQENAQSCLVEIQFAPSFRKHVDAQPLSVSASQLGDALEIAFETYPQLRGYVLDDQGAVRYHVAIFINNATIRDREGLSDSLSNGDRVFVFQALSGG